MCKRLEAAQYGQYSRNSQCIADTVSYEKQIKECTEEDTEVDSTNANNQGSKLFNMWDGKVLQSDSESQKSGSSDVSTEQLQKAHKMCKNLVELLGPGVEVLGLQSGLTQQPE
jgi:hypothetical protein